MSADNRNRYSDEDEDYVKDPRPFYDQGWFWVIVGAIVLFFFFFRPYLNVTITQ